MDWRPQLYIFSTQYKVNYILLTGDIYKKEEYFYCPVLFIGLLIKITSFLGSVCIKMYILSKSILFMYSVLMNHI